MDDWDKPRGGWKHNIRLCDLSLRPSMHKKGEIYYFSLFRTTKTGTPIEKIKEDRNNAQLFADEMQHFLHCLINDTSGWAIVTTPTRRHNGEWHFATEVCKILAGREKIKFYEGAIQCLNKDRIKPSFFLLRPIYEKRIIIIDDIITTGMTLTTAHDLFYDKQQVHCLIGINNR